MKRSGSRKNTRVARQALQIAGLAPVVASARIARVASSGDYGALAKMSTEKTAAFNSAATAMMFASAAVFWKSAFAFAQAWSPLGGTPGQRVARLGSILTSGSADIANSALAPIRKRVVANSKRLGR